MHLKFPYEILPVRFLASELLPIFYLLCYNRTVQQSMVFPLTKSKVLLQSFPKSQPGLSQLDPTILVPIFFLVRVTLLWLNIVNKNNLRGVLFSSHSHKIVNHKKLWALELMLEIWKQNRCRVHGEMLLRVLLLVTFYAHFFLSFSLIYFIFN